ERIEASAWVGSAAETQILRGVYREPLRAAQSDSKRSESAQNDISQKDCQKNKILRPGNAELFSRSGVCAIRVLAVVVISLGMSLGARAAARGRRVFTGNISDSACGLHHTMGSSAKQCTLMCVRMGSKFVLANETDHKVYALSDQAKAKPFAGENVRVVGTLKGSTIEVSSITRLKSD
ncbi:MAG: DUF5818 domain-containing protein, partial [Terriglobia bacterium]